MQQTRRSILDILRRRGQATVDDIVEDLRQQRSDAITSVTVRHHLNILQDEGLVATQEMRRRSTPGRPQHVYALTDKAQTYFPNNYQRLAQGLLHELEKHVPPEGVNVILEGVAQQMAVDASISDAPLPERLTMAVEYLSNHGYEAVWEHTEAGYMLHTSNCPYHRVANGSEALCEMDMRLIASLLGVVPRRLARLSAGGESCSYHIPDNRH